MRDIFYLETKHNDYINRKRITKEEVESKMNYYGVKTNNNFSRVLICKKGNLEVSIVKKKRFL